MADGRYNSKASDNDARQDDAQPLGRVTESRRSIKSALSKQSGIVPSEVSIRDGAYAENLSRVGKKPTPKRIKIGSHQVSMTTRYQPWTSRIQKWRKGAAKSRSKFAGIAAVVCRYRRVLWRRASSFADSVDIAISGLACCRWTAASPVGLPKSSLPKGLRKSRNNPTDGIRDWSRNQPFGKHANQPSAKLPFVGLP